MNLLHLQYFYVVAREGGFSRASHVLRVNQSALSRMVRQLEGSLQLVLLERQPRGVRLTEAGANVYARAAEIFLRVDELKSETDRKDKECQGELRVGSTDLIARNLLSPATAFMVQEWPNVYPTIQVGSVGETIPLISNGRLECGLFFHIPELPNSLAITQRWPVEFHLVCATKKANDKKVLRNFIGSREVDDTFNRRFPTLAKWKKHMPEAKIAISSNSLLLHYELVLAGTGISVLPHFLVSRMLKRGQLVDLLSGEKLIFDLKLVQRKNVGLSLNGRTFLAAVERAMA